MASVPDRAHNPNRVLKLKHEMLIKRPEAQVGISKERTVLHHDGAHASIEGPARMSGIGKASELGKIFAAIKATKPND
jgi:hypothetical protein